MKIRVTKKSNKKDVGIINLACAAAVHIKPRVGLEVYFSHGSQPAIFPRKVYKFEYVEVSGSGAVAYLEKPLDWILEKYGKGW